jgi:hypothetical protein
VISSSGLANTLAAKQFDFLFRGPGNVTVEDVVDNEDGTYTVFWSTTVAGAYNSLYQPFRRENTHQNLL